MRELRARGLHPAPLPLGLRELDLGTDPMVGAVAWTWLVEALENHRARYTEAGGTATFTAGRVLGQGSVMASLATEAGAYAAEDDFAAGHATGHAAQREPAQLGRGALHGRFPLIGDVAKENQDTCDLVVFPQWRGVRFDVAKSAVRSHRAQFKLRVLANKSALEFSVCKFPRIASVTVTGRSNVRSREN